MRAMDGKLMTPKRFGSLRLALSLTCLGLLAGVAQAANSAASSSTNTATSQESDSAAAELSAPDTDDTRPRRWRHHHEQRAVVNIGRDSELAASEHADDVVSVLGSSTSAGDVSDSVVSILGNTRVTGPVGDSAVAVLGNAYINSPIGHDVVAVLGNVDLGPQAQVSGDVVSVGGEVTRDPAAIVRGSVQSVGLGAHWGGFAWLHPWIARCLLYGRPLAFTAGVGWAWTLAIVALGFYVLAALLFRSALERCVQTLETYPLQSIVSALLTVLATPALLILLCITVIGILAIPFVGLALLAAESFGKLTVLAWIGLRLTKSLRSGASAHPALGVLIGGVIAMAIYTVPVVGFIAYKLIGFIGLGAVIYSLLLAQRSRRAVSPTGLASTAATMAAADAAAGDAASSSASASPRADSVAADSAAAAPGTAAGAPPHAEPPVAEPPGMGRTSARSAALLASYPRAGFWARMGALLLDVILIGVIVGAVLHSGRLHLLLLASYGAVMWKLRGTTIGGIVFNLQVVRLDTRELDWSTAIVRALSCFLSLFIVGLGFIWIAVDEEHQAWHDKIAGTIVVRLPKGVSLL
jgi:uncharacterized RDD family membrane protein YckC